MISEGSPSTRSRAAHPPVSFAVGSCPARLAAHGASKGPTDTESMTHDLQGIFDALLEGVLILDEADRIERVNPEARRLLGVGHDVAPGRTLGEALGADHPVCRVVERVRRSGRASIHDEVEIPQRFESPIPVDVAVSNIGETQRGRLAPIAIAMRDRSAARTLREEISERERQESYGHIAAGIAHEVRNPLGGIRGAAELIGMSSKDERSQKAASLIVREVDRISRLVDELMVFARGDRLESQSVNIHLPARYAARPGRRSSAATRESGSSAATIPRCPNSRPTKRGSSRCS